MASVVALVLAGFLLLPLSGQAFDQENASADGKFRSPFTIAVVPYAERSTPELRQLVHDITEKLSLQSGVRVVDAQTTNDLVDYYLSYVDTASRDSEALQFFRNAREAYNNAAYPEAQQWLAKTEAQVRQRMAQQASNSLLVDLLILKAKLAYVTEAKVQVPALYEEIASLNPKLHYTPGLYSKWEIQALAAAKRKVQAKGLASLQISGAPPQSDVYVNGIYQGATYYDKPLVIDALPLGQHCVEIKTVHHVPFLQYVRLESTSPVVVRATLPRILLAPPPQATIAPTRFQTPQELSHLMTNLGHFLKVDKLLLIHAPTPEHPHTVAYQVGIPLLGALQKAQQVTYSSKEGQTLALVTDDMRGELKKDVLSNPSDFLISTNIGSMKLHQKRRPELYRRPLFWVLIGAGAAGAGIGAVLVGGSTAASTGGVIIGL